MAVAEDDELLRSEAFQPDRAARVQFVGADADFRAEAIFEAVGETGGGVDHDRARIDLAQKPARAREIFGDDRIRMSRAVLFDVGNRLI